MTGEDARKAAAKTARGVKDSSGANYVSKNDNHVYASERSKPAQNVKPSGQTSVGNMKRTYHEYPTHEQYVSERFPDTHDLEAQVAHELEMREVKNVTGPGGPHDLPDQSPEMIRRRNGAARDARTNLGKSKAVQLTGNQ